MNTFENKLHEECGELGKLNERFGKINDFIENSKEYQELDSAMQRLLIDQSDAMLAYRAALSERISNYFNQIKTTI